MARKTYTSPAVKNRYNKKAYDRLSLTVRKGNKEIITAHAQSMGESTNAFILRAVEEQMKRDKEKGDE